MTVRDIRAGLQGLPRGLDQLAKAYDDTLTRLERQGPSITRLAQNIIRWIIHARRPLYAEELQEALAVKMGDQRLDNDNLIVIEELVAVCAGLVTVDKRSA